MDNQKLNIESIDLVIHDSGSFVGYRVIYIKLTKSTHEMKLSAYDVDHYLQDNLCGSFTSLPVVIIGGAEPFAQNIAPMIRTLVSRGYKVQIETDGSLYVENLPWSSIGLICIPSEKDFNKKLIPYIDGYKYMISSLTANEFDGLPNELKRPLAYNTKPIYVQPMKTKNKKQNELNKEICIKYCLRLGHIFQG